MFGDEPEVMNGYPTCLACGLRYQPTESYPPDRFFDWIAEWNRRYDVSDVDHETWDLRTAGEVLAQDRWLAPPFDRLPIGALFDALDAARGSVHLVTYGMSQQVLGALRMLEARGVSINGIVSGARPELIEEWKTAAAETWRFDLKLFPPERSASLPHTKLIVIDGKAAIYGSANLTLTGWRKVASLDEQVHLETDTQKVRRMHNLWFSRPLGPSGWTSEAGPMAHAEWV
jgi:phosphatidylserine/phosphatidylglycerophosphate/cardiolipin synthase-like enzyme